MEDNLKILKVDYLNNRFLDHTQILNLDLDDQGKVFKYFQSNWRRPQNIKSVIAQQPLYGSWLVSS
jgi:hypothetical protein